VPAPPGIEGGLSKDPAHLIGETLVGSLSCHLERLRNLFPGRSSVIRFGHKPSEFRSSMDKHAVQESNCRKEAIQVLGRWFEVCEGV